MVPCFQNPEYRCTGLVYRFHSYVSSAFAHSASVTALGCLKKGGGGERISTKRCFGHFQVSHLKKRTISSYKWLCLMRTYSHMLPSYLFFLYLAPLQWNLGCFTCNTLIEVAILFWGHSYIPTYQHDWLCNVFVFPGVQSMHINLSVDKSNAQVPFCS